MPVFKPAIYLYPEKPTEVNIKLDRAIKISIDIPKYDLTKGWNVLAYPDGRIKDMQPELTDCTKLDPNQFGLEYAQKACYENNYPYVYWDGIQTMKLLPDSDKGWVVKKEELKSFFEEKLSYVRFNDSEKAEFLAYWVPKLSAMKEEEFFIYFLQTEEIEKYLPMSVTPEPDSLNRFYLVAKKSTSRHQNFEPQELKKFERKGFTLVDWGGVVSD